MNKKILLIRLVFAIFLLPMLTSAATYYVDSDIGSDSNSCTDAQDTATPKQTVNGVMSCNPGAGDIVKFRGTFIHNNQFSHTIKPTQSGEVLYPFQPIQSVSGSTVTFSNPISGLNPDTDYVTIYNSRKGNSGAFAVTSFSGNTVTVDTSDLPWGSFISETAADPGDLHAAMVDFIDATEEDQREKTRSVLDEAILQILDIPERLERVRTLTERRDPERIFPVVQGLHPEIKRITRTR